MTQRFLLLSVFVLFSSIIEDTSRSLAATNDPASFVGDLGTRAIAAMRNGIRPRPSRSGSASCSVSISTRKPPPVLLSELIGPPRPRCSGGSSSNFTRITSSSAIPPPSPTSAAQASRFWGASPIGKGSSYRAGSRSVAARRSVPIGGSTRPIMAARSPTLLSTASARPPHSTPT